MARIISSLRRWIALLLAAILLLPLLPAAAFAESGTESPAVSSISADQLSAETDEVVSAPYTISKRYYTVRFYADGKLVSTLFVARNGHIDTMPAAPEVEGKTFVGWYLDGTPFTEKTRISFNLNLTAVYEDLPEEPEPTAAPEPAAAQYVFPQATVYLTDILTATGVTVENNSTLSVDSGLVTLSHTTAKKNNLGSITLTASAPFALATLTIARNSRIQTITLSYAGGGEEPEPTEEPAPVLRDGAIWANDSVWLSGKMPANAVVDAKPVEAEVDGQVVLAAWDIKIYANEKQREKGKTWKPAGNKVQVHFYSEDFDGEVNIYHLPDAKGAAEYVTTTQAQDDWVSFDADSFSVYVVTTLEKTFTASDGNTYKISVTYDASAGIPMGAELAVREISGDAVVGNSSDHLSERMAAALALGENDTVSYSKYLDIAIVKDGVEIEPQSPVEIRVQLLEVSGQEAQAIQVLHFGDSETTLLSADAGSDGEIVFETAEFSPFGFTSIFSTLLDWADELVSVTVRGLKGLFSSVSYEEIAKPVLEEGLEVMHAYRLSFRSKLGSLLSSLTGVQVDVSREPDLTLGERESVTVYSLADGEADAVLMENVAAQAETLSLGSADGFVVVKDTGFRHKNFSLDHVTLDGMMPKGVEKAEAEDAAQDQKVTALLDGLEGNVLLSAYDISILEHGAEYQPTADRPIHVEIESPRITEENADDIALWHIRDDGVTEQISDFTVANGKVIFDADSFSIYPITGHDENARIGYRFWYNDGSQNVLLSTQYFRYKDVHPASGNALQLYQPSIPGMDTATWNRIFKGWSKGAPLTDPNPDPDDLYDLNELNAELNGLIGTDYNETVTDLYANLENVYYVTYVDVNPNNVLTTEIVPKEAVGNTTFTIKTEAELRPTIDSDTRLEGWRDSENISTLYTPGQAGVVIRENLTLYPAIHGGHWLVFDDNDLVDNGSGTLVSGGASFTPPAFYMNEVTVRPADPTWDGYEFGGWYTDAACTTPFTFGQVLTQETTVYAKWTPSASSYRVIIWKQRATDAVNTAEDEKTYDYVTSDLITEGVVTGQTITLANRYKNIYGASGTSSDTDKQYFTYNSAKTDQSVIVKADGTSVLNVYYDRVPITLAFKVWDYAYTETTATNNNTSYYGLVDGNYVLLTRSGSAPNYLWSYDNNNFTVVSNPDTSVTTEGTYYGLYNGTYVDVYYFSNYQYTGWVRVSGNYLYRYDGNIFAKESASYTGTRYVRNGSTRSWREYKTFTGLYGALLEDNGYTWPAEYNWYSTGENNGATSGTRTTFMASFLPTDNQTTTNFYGSTSSGSSYVNFYIQEADGSYTRKDRIATSTGYNGSNFYISDKYIGYHASQYQADNDSWRNVGNKTNDGYYNNGTPVAYRNVLNIRFDRNERTLTFYTNNGSNQLIDYPVYYGTSLSSYAGQNEGQRNGYYFLGWYADPGCTEEFDFSQTMPDNNIAVYGKWKMERVRVVIEPGASNVYMGSQARAFRVDHDEHIDGGLLETATRAGYILDGWYTDPDFTNRFLFSNPINSHTPGVDMTYQTGANWAAARAAYGDDDEDHENVRGILHLYAKWILDPDSSGYNVVYDAGEAAIRDDLGNLLTTVPIDTRMYAFGEGATPSAREAPANYNELYSFSYWEAIKEDGTPIQLVPGAPIPLSELRASDTVYGEDNEVFRKTITLRAVYTTTAGDRLTHITYDGDTFNEPRYPSGTREVQGKTKDGTQRTTVTYDEQVNQTIVLPDNDDFYLNGYTLVGWSFFEGTYEQQIAQENSYNAAHPDNTVMHFAPDAEVAADNLTQNPVNNEANILYAMWQPKTYTVTVRQVIESGVQANANNSFPYAYKTGVENSLNAAAQNAPVLTGNASFTVQNTTATPSEALKYYDVYGHVISIETPTIPANANYDVRVNAIVAKDDGTTEILNPDTLGNYQILGDVVITYTYSLKVEVKLQKRDATNHNKTLTGASFVFTPVEYNTATSRWENAGAGRNVTISSATETVWLQEGTYKISEVTPPTDNTTAPPTEYAVISTDLYLTISKEGRFRLFNSAGQDVNAQIAELDSSTGRVLAMYDHPIRTVTLKKNVKFTGSGSFNFTVTVFESDGTTRLRNYNIGTGMTTNSIGQVTLTLGHNETAALKIPHGCRLTVEETFYSSYITSYVWDEESETSGRVFGATPVEITKNADLTFINEPLVAPTGISMTTLPYVLMLGAGAALALVAVLRRRKSENNA